MSKIKLKENIKRDIKTIEKVSNDIQEIKQKADNISTKESPTEKASNDLILASKIATKETVEYAKYKGNKEVKNTINNIKSTKQKVKLIKEKRALKKEVKKGIKNTKKGVKTAKQTAKTTEKAAKTSAKAIKESTKAAIKSIKAAIQLTIKIIKGIIAAVKSLISAIIAGGWAAVVIIIVIALISILCSSIYGIFFSSEKENGNKMSEVVKEINNDMAERIKQIQSANQYDDYKIESHRADWKEVLAVYTVDLSKGTNEVDVMTIDDNKKKKLKDMFWEFNEISSYVNNEEVNIEETNTHGIKRVLHIVINSKSKEEIMNKHLFSDVQRNQVNELLSKEYSTMWASVIHGTPLGSPDIVEIALSQVGNVGGEPYWRWYGFNERVEWCACFVSWVADQLGLIDANVIPKFAGCQNGIDWFKAMGQWQDRGYVPQAGDIIFFDWELDGTVSHVGIVKEVTNGKIYTIEGNSSDECKERDYDINSGVILGFGTPSY